MYSLSLGRELSGLGQGSLTVALTGSDDKTHQTINIRPWSMRSASGWVESGK